MANAGRRTVQIEKIGWVPPGRTRFVKPTGYMGFTGLLPAELGEGDARDFPIEESLLSDGVLAAVAWDKLGRAHFGAFERLFRGLLLGMKALPRLPHYR